MNAWLGPIAEALTPWKEVIGSAFAALAAVGALVSGVLKQRGRTDTTFVPPVPAPASAGTVRLHADDRESLGDFRSTIGDLREAVEDLARETRRNTKATEDNTEALGDNTGALNRRGGGGGNGGRRLPSASSRSSSRSPPSCARGCSPNRRPPTPSATASRPAAPLPAGPGRRVRPGERLPRHAAA